MTPTHHPLALRPTATWRRQMSLLALLGLLAASLLLAPSAHAADETASYALDIEVKLQSDVRNRAISDSLLGPGGRASVQWAHESGLIALAELTTVSKKQFLGGQGYSATLAAGYRFGDPEAWHFGVGAATELFPGAKFDAPHAIDLATLSPTDVRSTRYDSSFGLLEVGYGALESRVLYVLSKTYRGADTGGVCGTLLSLNPDPMVGLDCYARGDHNSQGSWLADLGYKIQLNPSTALNLHGGMQKIRHFREADTRDWSVGVTHKRWGFEWTAEWLAVHTEARELYLVADGDRLRATDNNKLVATVSRKF